MKRFATVLAGWCLVAGCGGGSPKVALHLVEASQTQPCLGATHMEILVSGQGKGYKTDFYEQMFLEDTFACNFGDYQFSNLPMSNGYRVTVNLYDSSLDNNFTGRQALLTEGFSREFNVVGGSADQLIEISLSRRTEAKHGTIFIGEKPGDWNGGAGLKSLRFSANQASDAQVGRTGYIVFDPKKRPDPFPIVISNLEEPAVSTPFQVQLEGSDENSNPVKTWNATVDLQAGVLAKVQWGS